MTDSSLHDSGLTRAIEEAGSQSALARILGTRQSTVSSWLHSGSPLPTEYVLTVERELGISRHFLRPDLSEIFSREESPAHPSAPPLLRADGSSFRANRGDEALAGARS